jgi:hypothetical protein
MRWDSRLLLAAALSCLVVAFLPSTAMGAHGANVNTRYITAKNVKTFEGLGCSKARQTLRRYFRKVVRTGQVQGGCAHQRFSTGCRVGSFRCFADGDAGRGGECLGPLGSVLFREFDRAPG